MKRINNRSADSFQIAAEGIAKSKNRKKLYRKFQEEERRKRYTIEIKRACGRENEKVDGNHKCAHTNSLKNQRPNMQVAATSLIPFEMDTLTELYGSFNPT